MGFLIYSIDESQMDKALKLTLIVGFCGGFTTFSTFSMELFELIKNSQFIIASIYILLSILLGIVGLWLGVQFARYIIS